MADSKKVGLFITRVQPGMHFWQIDGIEQAMEQGVTHFLIGIGSSNKEYTKENPFLYDERKKMLELSCSHIKWAEFQILFLPDFENDEAWKNYVLNELPDFDCVVTWNPWVRDILASTEKTLVWLKIRKNIKGTFLRDQLALGRIDELRKSLHPEVVEYLQEIDAASRLREIFKTEYQSPHLTVDVVFKDQDWDLVLIERKNYPHGIALQWWFVGYGEKPEDAAIREVKEETWADIKIKSLIWVYGDVDRDPRAHLVTVVYEGEYVWWTIVAWDDAKAIKKVKAEKTELDKIDFVADHAEILQKYLENVKLNNL